MYVNNIFQCDMQHAWLAALERFPDSYRFSHPVISSEITSIENIVLEIDFCSCSLHQNYSMKHVTMFSAKTLNFGEYCHSKHQGEITWLMILPSQIKLNPASCLILKFHPYRSCRIKVQRRD